MRAKTVSVIILVLTFLLVLFACNSIPHIADTVTQSGHANDTPYTISKNEDLTYSYRIIAHNGDVLFSDDCSPREPKINQVSDNVLSVAIQTGTGRSTNWAVFCDVANAKTSETFQYVLGSQGDYVVCANYEDGKHFIVVQNIFDKVTYYKTYELENVSPVAADFALDCKFDMYGNATVTYLTGKDYTETVITINIP